MTMIIVTAHIEGDVAAFEADVCELLQKHNCQIDFKSNAGSPIYVASFKQAEEPTVANDALPQETSIELPQEIEVTLAAPQDEVGADIPPPVEVPAELPAPEVSTAPIEITEPTVFKDVIVKSLSTACTVPSTIDRSLHSSFLRASNVSVNGDLVLFTYCGMSYQFPVQRNSDNAFMAGLTCNVSPIYATTTIRVVVSPTDDQNVASPCLLQVVDRGQDTFDSITFGQDLADIVFAGAGPAA